MRSPGEIVRHIVTGEIVGDVDIPGISAVDSIGSMRLAKPLWTQSHDRGAGLRTGIGMGDWNPFLPVIYSSTALLLVALAVAVVLVYGASVGGLGTRSPPVSPVGAGCHGPSDRLS